MERSPTMSVAAQTLRNLHRIHRQLADLSERIVAGPKQVQAKQHGVDYLEGELANAQEAVKNAKMTADRKQLSLKSGESKIGDLETKLNTCSTNREYQALMEQIAADKMANSVLEDEILELLDRIEQFQANVVELKEKLVVSKAELEKTSQEVHAKVEVLQRDHDRLVEELGPAEAELPEDLLNDYNRNVGERGEDGLAAVDENVCQGCFTQVTPNTAADLLMNRIIVCKSCGRLLYRSQE